MRAPSSGHLALVAVVAALAGFPATAQQYLAESAALPDAHSIELEAWYGKQVAGVRPGVSVLSWLEPRVQASWIRKVDAPRDAIYFVEAKLVPLSIDEHPFGLGALVGFDLDRLRQFLGSRGPGGAYALALASAMPMEDHFYLHANFGWAYLADKFLTNPDRPNHRFVWALQAVALPVERVELTVESAGTSFDPPVYQAGVSFRAIPDYLKATLSVGGSIIGHLVPFGFTLGIIVDTPALW